jgi:predicted alpha/beta hydrolase
MQLRANSGPDRTAVAEDHRILAGDGFELWGRLWFDPSSARPAYVALINPGAGIVAAYYERFAEFLAEAGFPTLVYDYRGIGRSRPRSLRGFAASVEEWGSKDCAAVLNWLARRFPGVARLVIGHSVGGFLTGFAENGQLINRMLLVGAHTGYWGDYAPGARLRMYCLWHVLMPAVTHVFGYFPGRRFGLLEDLPAGVAMQWASRRRPDFWWNLKSSEGKPDIARIKSILARFGAIRAQTLALRFADDPFATAVATERILSLYANCTSSTLEICPMSVTGQPIGHFGFFRSRFRSTLWQRALDWLHGTLPEGAERPAATVPPVPRGTADDRAL